MHGNNEFVDNCMTGSYINDHFVLFLLDDY